MAERISEMPQDLQDFLGHSDLRLPVREQPEPDLVSETLRTGSQYSTVLFPVSLNGEERFGRLPNTPMMVFVVIPGGFEEVNSGDQNLCIELAKKTGAICVATSHSSGIKNGIESMKEHCESVFQTVLQDCDGIWKQEWGTDSKNVLILASSFAALLAIHLQQKFGVLALGLIVPLFDTNPGGKQNPWGENGDVPGLNTRYLLNSLRETFKGVSRDDWRNNLSKMPDSVRMELPPMCIALAEFDPLYVSGKEFADHQTVLVKQKIVSKTFRSVHQVKDLEKDTEEGRNLRDYLMQQINSLLASGHSIWPHWSLQPKLLV